MIYYPIVDTDAKEEKTFSEEEIWNTEPFEESLEKIKFKYISHKKQNIDAKRAQKFEFECDDENIDIVSFFFPEDSKILKKKIKNNNRFIFYFGFNERKKFMINFRFFAGPSLINSIVYYADYKGEIDIPISEPDVFNKDIILIEPVFPVLKIGKEITLKFKSDVVEEITVSNNTDQNLKKNKDGIFEVKLIPLNGAIAVLKKKEDGGKICMFLNVSD